jgi:hypothetical protein
MEATMKAMRMLFAGSTLTLGLFALAAAISAGDAYAVCRDGSCGGETPACSALSCTDKADCGSKCFCNNPKKLNSAGSCYVD